MTYQELILSHTPINYWRLDNTSSPFTPASGTVNLAWTGSTTLNTSPAPPGISKGVVFDGVSGAYAATGLTRSNSGSWEAWAKFSSGSNSAPIFAVTKNNSPYNKAVLWADGSIQMYGSNNYVKYSNSSHYLDNEWHHFVATCDNVTTRIYIDGVLIADASGINGVWLDYISHDRIAVGRLVNVESPPFYDGCISEVAVYDYALSVEQIAAHYAMGYVNPTPVQDEATTNLNNARQRIYATRVAHSILGNLPSTHMHTHLLSGHILL